MVHERRASEVLAEGVTIFPAEARSALGTRKTAIRSSGSRRARAASFGEVLVGHNSTAAHSGHGGSAGEERTDQLMSPRHGAPPVCLHASSPPARPTSRKVTANAAPGIPLGTCRTPVDLCCRLTPQHHSAPSAAQDTGQFLPFIRMATGTLTPYVTAPPDVPLNCMLLPLYSLDGNWCRI